MPLVASVDYTAKRIYLTSEATLTPLDTMDVYREVRALRVTTFAHRRFKPMIVGGGNIEKITGVSFTQPYVQLLYGCRIVPADASSRIVLIRETFTDDGVAGADCFDRATLSNNVEVDIDVQVSSVEVRRVSGGSGLDATQAAQLAVIFGQLSDIAGDDHAAVMLRIDASAALARDHARAANVQTQKS